MEQRTPYSVYSPSPIHPSRSQMRYIIEAALVQSRLLNRTLILPSFVYARACEYNM